MVSLQEYSERIDKAIASQREGMDRLLFDISERISKEEQKRMQAAEEGDLRENAGYTVATENLARLEIERRNIYNKMEAFKKFNSSYEYSGFISVGSTVVLVENNEQEYIIKLVPPALGDSSIGAVSINSPVGKEILGKQRGQTVVVKSPVSILEYRIKDVY